MRLYRLMQRFGLRKSRMYPWFEPPAPEAPMRYAGWVWNPATKEWDKVKIDKVTVEFQVPKYPEPTEPPRPAQRRFVLGWEYSIVLDRWVATPMPTDTKWVTPERPPEPTEWPSRTQPAEVIGWRYSFMYRVWEKIPMVTVEVEVERVRPPKPEYPPGPKIPHETEGWSWSDTHKEWIAVSIVAQKVGFTPPPTLPPGIDLTLASFPGQMEMLRNHISLWAISQGLGRGEAEGFARRAMEDFAGYGKAMTRDMYGRIWGHYAIGFWEKLGRLKFPIPPKHAGMTIEGYNALLQEAKMKGFIAFLILVATLTGVAIGAILERLSFPPEDRFILAVPPGTYLLGPDDWRYSRHVGCSLDGRPYYSMCEGIGTEWVRHKRLAKDGIYDIIDFPGGFLEEGFDFPYWVKYIWSYWVIQYVGMLYSVREGLYALKKADEDWYAGLPPGVTLKYEDWCKDFHYYL